MQRRMLGLMGLAVMAGCGGADRSDAPTADLHTIRGLVLVDGQPAAGAQVILHPQASTVLGMVTPHGEVADDGSFVVTTYEFGDGAPEGLYKATVSWQPVLNPNRSEPDYGPEKLPIRYQDPMQSGIEFQVKPEANELAPIVIATR